MAILTTLIFVLSLEDTVWIYLQAVFTLCHNQQLEIKTYLLPCGVPQALTLVPLLLKIYMLLLG